MLELLLVGEAGRVSELLVLVEGRRLPPHARVVVQGWVDVAHMASSIHRLRLLTSLWRTLRPGMSEHHLGLNVGQAAGGGRAPAGAAGVGDWRGQGPRSELSEELGDLHLPAY